jgi:hypothetical protein
VLQFNYVKVSGLVWDEWNREHLARHNVLPEEVEEVCHGKYVATESYRKRLLIVGKTKKGRQISIVLSPEGRDLEFYGNGIYYAITAFDREEVKK